MACGEPEDRIAELERRIEALEVRLALLEADRVTPAVAPYTYPWPQPEPPAITWADRHTGQPPPSIQDQIDRMRTRSGG